MDDHSKFPLGSHLVTWDFGTFGVNLNSNISPLNVKFLNEMMLRISTPLTLVCN
jgi:hypothetical protein